MHARCVGTAGLDTHFWRSEDNFVKSVLSFYLYTHGFWVRAQVAGLVHQAESFHHSKPLFKIQYAFSCLIISCQHFEFPRGLLVYHFNSPGWPQIYYANRWPWIDRFSCIYLPGTGITQVDHCFQVTYTFELQTSTFCITFMYWVCMRCFYLHVSCWWHLYAWCTEGYWIPWNCSYSRLWATMWVLGIKSVSLKRLEVCMDARDVRSPGARIIGNCKPPNIDSGLKLRTFTRAMAHSRAL